MRVLVCGDRMWGRYYNGESKDDPVAFARVENQKRVLYTALDEEHANEPITVLIEGEAPGADKMGRWWAEHNDVLVMPFYANWSKYGRGAGPIRNTEMLVYGKPDKVIAAHDDLENSKGTRNMVTQALHADVPVRFVTTKEKEDAS